MNRKTAIPLLAGVAGLLLFLGYAQAQPAADPIATSAASADAVLSLILTFGPLWGGMAIVFGVASTLLKRNESTHWIAQGRVLAVITAAVAVGIAALKAHFAGAPWAGVLLTAVLGLFKLIDPTTVVTPSTSSAPAPVKVDQAGIVSPRLLVLLALIAAIGVGGYALSGCDVAPHGTQSLSDHGTGGSPASARFGS
jgi:hypothetical protein